MTDLIDQEGVDSFKEAMRDISDTFDKYPVVAVVANENHYLHCGRKLITEKIEIQEGGEEIDQAYRLKFNREYLQEMELIDNDDNLIISYDDHFLLDQKRFLIIKIEETPVFRDTIMNVIFEVVR